MTSWHVAIYVMWYRQIIRFVRMRSRLISSVLQPIMWLIFIGVGFSSALRGQLIREVFGGLSYITFMAPGIVVMSSFFTAFFSAISVIWDREFGFLKEILVAPVPRAASIFGRALGDSTVALAQAALVLAASYVVVPSLRLEGAFVALLASLLAALTVSGLGIAIASRIKSFEGFHLINMLIAMPMLFLSNTFYPLKTMPDWMRIASSLNPVTYGVDLARYSLTGVSYFAPAHSLSILLSYALAFTILATYAYAKTTIE